MPRFHRKTAPGVRDGRIRRKNNWTRTPTCYNTPQLTPAIDRRRPGAGYRHLLLKRDVERFVDLLPYWEDVSRDLDVIVLDRGRPGCDGWYDRGVIGICAWPAGMSYPVGPRWDAHHSAMLARLGVRVEDRGEEGFFLDWKSDTARAYQLCHVFLHEIGHHIDRLSTRSKRDNAPRGEDWADHYAWAYEAVVWERYCKEFGLPD